MNAVVIEHVKVSDLPEAWRGKLAASSEARVTVRIEAEGGTSSTHSLPPMNLADDPLFGLWQDRVETTDAATYLRQQRAPRF